MSRHPAWDFETEWAKIERSREKILRFVRNSPSRRGRDPRELTHEIIRETVLRCWRSGKRIRLWLTYLRKAAYLVMSRPLSVEERVCVAFHTLNWEPAKVAERFASSWPSPLDRLLRAEELGLVMAQLRLLPWQQGRVMQLVCLGFTNSEVSVELGMKPGTVRYHKHHGIKALRKMLRRAA